MFKRKENKQNKFKRILLKLLNIEGFEKETFNIINPNTNNVSKNFYLLNDKTYIYHIFEIPYMLCIPNHKNLLDQQQIILISQEYCLLSFLLLTYNEVSALPNQIVVLGKIERVEIFRTLINVLRLKFSF